MRGRLSALLLLALSGCQGRDEALIDKCEAILLPTLKAPSTYKRIETTVGLPEKNGQRSVFIKYDAVNTYNAPIRETFWCVIKKNGVADVGGGGTDMIADNMEALADNIAAAALPPDTPNPFSEKPDPTPSAVPTPFDDEEVPVCDQPDSPAKSALMNEIGVDCLGE